MNDNTNPARRLRHGQRPTEPLEFDEPAATSGDASDLRAAILSLPCEADPALGSIAVHSYKRGHAEARQAAADLVARIESAAAPAPSDWIIRDPHGVIASLRAASQLMAVAACKHIGWNDNNELYKAASHLDNALAAVVGIESAAAPATASGDELLDMAVETLRFYADPKNNCPGAAARQILTTIDARRAAVSAATKPTADLSKLVRYEWTRDGMDSSMDEPARWTEPAYYKVDDVQSLLATKPAAPAVPKSANFNMLRAMVEAGDKCNVYMDWRQAAAIYEAALAAAPAASTPAAPADDKHLPGWERGIATVTLSGHQLRAALDLIAPDEDELQLEDELTFGIVQHKDDAGTVSTGMCCWNGDTDGVLPLDGDYTATPAASTTGAAQTAEQVRDLTEVQIIDACFGIYHSEHQDSAHGYDLAIADAVLRAAGVRPTPTHSSEAGDE